jgi:hypothetical protein
MSISACKVKCFPYGKLPTYSIMRAILQLGLVTGTMHAVSSTGIGCLHIQCTVVLGYLLFVLTVVLSSNACNIGFIEQRDLLFLNRCCT